MRWNEQAMSILRGYNMPWEYERLADAIVGLAAGFPQ